MDPNNRSGEVLMSTSTLTQKTSGKEFSKKYHLRFLMAALFIYAFYKSFEAVEFKRFEHVAKNPVNRAVPRSDAEREK